MKCGQEEAEMAGQAEEGRANGERHASAARGRGISVHSLKPAVMSSPLVSPSDSCTGVV